jgi:hypothetical protein
MADHRGAVTTGKTVDRHRTRLTLRRWRWARRRVIDEKRSLRKNPPASDELPAWRDENRNSESAYFRKNACYRAALTFRQGINHKHFTYAGMGSLRGPIGMKPLRRTGIKSGFSNRFYEITLCAARGGY